MKEKIIERIEARLKELGAIVTYSDIAEARILGGIEELEDLLAELRNINA